MGFSDKYHKYDENMLCTMRDLLMHSDNYVKDKLFSDENIYASRTHLGILDQGEQPYILNSRFFSWFEGEFYNQKELKSKYIVTSTTDNELLVNIYNATRSFKFLRDIDGCYTAVLYDQEINKVYLITDRYGFKPLYWRIINEDLAWSSEVKGFLGHRDFNPVIDVQSVAEFFNMGYVLENRTWFEKIELVPPASILTFDVKKSKIEIQSYWYWNEIEQMKSPIDERELIESFGLLFKNAVLRHVKNDEKVGILLSGGLDSRAILAAFPEDYKPLHTFTFGKKQCDDIKIANRISIIKGTYHHIWELNSNNWLIPRINFIWRSDGLLNLIHMHGLEFLNKAKLHIEFCLNGFLAGGSLGGAYIAPSYYNDIGQNHSEEYMIRNRGRRLINQAIITGETWLIYRRPFFNKELVDFAFSIPGNLRQGAFIYKKMLLATFSNYYKNIPWQKTCYPINCPDLIAKAGRFSVKVKNRISKYFGLELADFRNYTDYPHWIRQEPGKSFFEKILRNSKALYQEYISREKVEKDLDSHLQGNDRADILCRYLTFEIWLQQVFEGNYRSNRDLF